MRLLHFFLIFSAYLQQKQEQQKKLFITICTIDTYVGICRSIHVYVSTHQLSMHVCTAVYVCSLSVLTRRDKAMPPNESILSQKETFALKSELIRTRVIPLTQSHNSVRCHKFVKFFIKKEKCSYGEKKCRKRF